MDVPSKIPGAPPGFRHENSPEDRAFNPNTWGAYFLNGDLFVKSYRADPAARYPDFGCSLETFTNQEMLELETLGPVCRVLPGEWIEHVERWTLHRAAAPAAWTDDGLDAALGEICTY